MDFIKTQSFELAILARGNENSKKLALLIPGRLDTKDYANFVGHAEYLAQRGFFAVAFDPPGTWDSPGSIDLYTATNYLKAINELIEHFGNRQTLLIVHSRGVSAAMLASNNPVVMGIVAILANYELPSPPQKTSLILGFETSYRDMPPGDHKTTEQKIFKLPLSYWEDAKQYDPLSVLKQSIKPKLLISATNDEFYSPEDIKKIYESVPEPKMLGEINTDHDYRYFPEAIEEVNNIIGRFLEKYLSN